MFIFRRASDLQFPPMGVPPLTWTQPPARISKPAVTKKAASTFPEASTSNAFKLPVPSIVTVPGAVEGRMVNRCRQQPGEPLDGYSQTLSELAGTPKPPPTGAVRIAHVWAPPPESLPISL